MRALFIVGVLVLTACGGNWSNRDLDFVDALPDRATLQSKLPQTATTSSPLTGVSTRRDPLGVGEPSKAYADTKKASTDFNAILATMLAAIDLTRQVAPTARTPDSRTWGPYPDSKNPGFEFRVVVTQVDEANFSWSIDSRKRPADFFSLASGSYAPTESLKRGRGEMTLHVKDFKSQLAVDEGLKALDEIVIGYVTDMFPTRVEMLFTFAAGNPSGLSAIGYTSREQADGSGS
ncbi:MAG: hypothetical protein JNG84_10165, partial [Archangium sp.]|nr:hypothetical protein [Archangium sp.]